MELSFSEILAVLVVALLVFGPEEMVRKSRQLGSWIGKMKSEMNNFRVLTEEALLDSAQKKELKQLASDLNQKIGVKKVTQSPHTGENGESEIEESILALAKKSKNKAESE